MNSVNVGNVGFDEDIRVETERKFRESLEDSINREAFVKETSLEYRRLAFLRGKGIKCQPESGSLLDKFLLYAPVITDSNNSDSEDTYKSIFGHSMPYVWTVSVDRLTLEGAAPNHVPGGA